MWFLKTKDVVSTIRGKVLGFRRAKLRQFIALVFTATNAWRRARYKSFRVQRQMAEISRESQKPKNAKDMKDSYREL